MRTLTSAARRRCPQMSPAVRSPPGTETVGRPVNRRGCYPRHHAPPQQPPVTDAVNEPIGMRRVGRVYRKVAALLAVGLLATSMAACGSGDKAPSGGGATDDGKLTLGFSQVGAESGWRTANTKSIQESAKDA